MTNILSCNPLQYRVPEGWGSGAWNRKFLSLKESQRITQFNLRNYAGKLFESYRRFNISRSSTYSLARDVWDEQPVPVNFWTDYWVLIVVEDTSKVHTYPQTCVVRFVWLVRELLQPRAVLFLKLVCLMYSTVCRISLKRTQVLQISFRPRNFFTPRRKPW